MGQAPATGSLSLRTVPRNFPGRSGTREDKVCLVSPETAAASALKAEITDPRTIDIPYPHVVEPQDPIVNRSMFVPPLPPEKARRVHLAKGPNIATLPALDQLPESVEAPVLLVLGDDVSTDEIMPAGTRVLPFRSNIPKLAEFAFADVDATYVVRAKDAGAHVIVAGGNYGQGSSREHAALAPRYLGLRVVLAKSFARIHLQNLVNFGILPLTFVDPEQYREINGGDVLRFAGLRRALAATGELVVENIPRSQKVRVCHRLSPRQVQLVLGGGLINWIRQRLSAPAGLRGA